MFRGVDPQDDRCSDPDTVCKHGEEDKGCCCQPVCPFSFSGFYGSKHPFCCMLPPSGDFLLLPHPAFPDELWTFAGSRAIIGQGRTRSGATVIASSDTVTTGTGKNILEAVWSRHCSIFLLNTLLLKIKLEKDQAKDLIEFCSGFTRSTDVTLGIPWAARIKASSQRPKPKRSQPIGCISVSHQMAICSALPATYGQLDTDQGTSCTSCTSCTHTHTNTRTRV